MGITAEAKQIMVQALSKMYSSRTQRGGLRLHRSLLLTLVMKSARDIYHSARLTSEEKGQSDTYGVTENTSQAEEPMDTTSSTTAPLRSAATQATEDGQRSGLEGHSLLRDPARLTVDKENCNPTKLDRHSRKRRSKTATDPDFLPCKKAKLEFLEVRGILQATQNNSAICGRALDSLSLVPMPRTIVTF
ncbi:immediate early response gene 2 protein-like [Sinocyclocheilus anshuiensis]|uniref:Immediate early response gene 2 protein-like n=1 Tax=Sinocyclocheilus anshuiensis TaxID=1608454 RepID=A0A671P4Z7_9TELE|nr:PREDICTED: immediate early response gene 2 protein-like [Sinocyclocheilus anshuiensis]